MRWRFHARVAVATDRGRIRVTYLGTNWASTPDIVVD